MKKLKFLLIIILISNLCWAQAPGEFNYQTVVRDNNGDLISNQSIDIKITILDESSTGSILLTETHAKTSNDFGLVNLKIGSIETASFSDIDWSHNDKYLKVEVDIGNGFVDLGAVQFLSLPYSLFSNLADSSVFSSMAYTANYADSAAVAGMAHTSKNAENADVAELANTLGSDAVYSTSSDTLFVVKDHDGKVVFAVFPDGAQVIINEAAKGTVGGFAVSGRSPTKATDIDVLKVTPDSTRIYINDTVSAKGTVGGFAVSGRSPTKSNDANMLFINADSTRVYVNDEPSVKGKVGGFSVSGRSPTKGTVNNFLDLTPDNYFIGHQSGISIFNGLYNSFFGYQSGMDNYSGSRNIFMGYQSGLSNISGSDNTFVGNQSGMDQQTGDDNIYIGNESGENIISGTRNIYIGKQAGFNANTSLNTVAIGFQSGYSNTVDNNTFVGPFSGLSNSTGRENVYMGHTSAQMIQSGSRNVILGAWAGHNGPKGDNNVIIGSYAGNVTADSLGGNVMIGFNVGRFNTSSNRLYIDNSSTNSPLIWGDFSTNAVTINGNFHATGNITSGGTTVVPDYVFESNYELETIEEHAEFMWKEKHLPAVKSAKEIEAEGVINLNERREQLLEELEKAHIYIEQLNNEVKSIKEENIELKQKLNEIIEMLEK